jgi:hypothetical protein
MIIITIAIIIIFLEQYPTLIWGKYRKECWLWFTEKESFRAIIIFLHFITIIIINNNNNTIVNI